MSKQLFKPSDLNKTVAFTTIKSVQNPNNGSMSKKPVTLFTKKGAQRRRTLNQQYSALGTTIEDSIVIGVRHDSRITKALSVLWKGEKYEILDISPDESNTYITYDLITVKKVSK